VPNGVTYVAGSLIGGDANDDTNPDGTGLTWTLTALNGGQSRTLEFQATVDGGALALNPIDNTADIVSFDQTDSILTDNTSTAALTVLGLDLEVVKTVSDENPEEGELITYTITLNNLSSQAINGVEITDVVPVGVTYVVASAAGTTVIDDSSPAGTGIVWTVPGDITNGTPVVLTFDATVDAGTAPGATTIDNTAFESAMNQTDSNNANNTSTVSIDPIGLDIEVLKAVSEATPTEGDTVTYTITVNNLSSQTASDINIGDVVPSGVTYVTGSISGGNSNSEATPITGDGLTWVIDSLAGLGSATLTFDASVNAATAATTITNNALLLSLTETEDNASNNTGSAVITPRAFDIAILKSVDDDTAEEGQEITFTVNVENTSTTDGTNIVVQDVLPSGLTFVAGSQTGPGATYDAGTRTFTWTIPTLLASNNLNLTYRTTVDAGATTTYVTAVNTASYVSSDQIDSATTNNTSSVTVTFVGIDIEVQKSVSVTNPEEGDTVTYTVNVNNTSTQAATNIEITDVLPVGVTYVTASATGPGAAYDAGTRTLTWLIPNLAGAAGSVLTFNTTVDAGTAGTTITNSASLSNIDQSESNTINNTGTVDINPVGLDIEILKAVDSPTPTEGDTVVYTITANNLSSQAATTVNISDVLPTGITYIASSVTGPGANYDAGTNTLTWTLATLAGGASEILTFSATVDPSTAGTTVSNSATLVSLDQTDDNAANNIGTVNIAPVGFDIAIAKSVSAANPEESSVVTYTINVENISAAPGTNIVVTDIVPSGVTYVASSIAGPAGVVTDDLDPAGTGLTWSIPSINASATLTLSFQASVDLGTAGTTVTNTANRTSSDQVDSNPVNDAITVTNLTTQDATNVNISDVLPVGITYVPASVTGPGANYDAGTRTFTWTLPTVSNGTPIVLDYDVTVDSGSASLGVLSNTANLVSLDQTDSNAVNNNSVVDIDPVGLDVQVLKTVSDTTPEEGETVVYTITVNNLSSQPATNLTIGDIVPTGVTYTALSITGGDSNSDATPTSGAGLTWTINTLAGSGTSVLSFSAVVDASTSGTTIVNDATLNSLDQTDDNAVNNIGSATITPVGVDLAVSKSVSEINPVEGNTITYTVNVENLSSQGASNIVISDVLPAGVTYVASSATGPGASYDAGTKISLDQTDDNATNDSGSVSIVPVSFDIAVDKSVDDNTAEEGQSITFTITATNTTAVDGTNVEITDVLPSGLTFVSAVPSDGTVDTTDPSGTGLVWTLASVLGNDS